VRGRGEGAAACLNRNRAFPARFLIGIGKCGFPMPPLRAALPCAGSRRGRRSYTPRRRPAPGPMGRGEGAAAWLNRKRAFPARFLIGIGKRGFPMPPLRTALPCAGSRRGRRCLFEAETGFPCPFPHRHRKTRFPDASASRRTSLCGCRGEGAAPTFCGRPALGPICRWHAVLSWTCAAPAHDLHGWRKCWNCREQFQCPAPAAYRTSCT
jgi:hypothetical protein